MLGLAGTTRANAVDPRVLYGREPNLLATRSAALDSAIVTSTDITTIAHVAD
jgi:hypothetical protein